MDRRMQILVIGYSDKQWTDNAYQLAYEVGKEIASHGAVLITGGLRGVMEAASRGATEKGGLAVGIIPQEDKSFANEYCSIVIATGSGWLRDFITAYSG
ncbi:MAG: TIGR00725 family protein, partial [Candidatus Bathyarchaeia archaeon]